MGKPNLDDFTSPVVEAEDYLFPRGALSRLLRTAEGPDGGVAVAGEHRGTQGTDARPEHVVEEAQTRRGRGRQVDTGGGEVVRRTGRAPADLGVHVDRATRGVVVQRASVEGVLDTVGLDEPTGCGRGIARPAIGKDTRRTRCEAFKVLVDGGEGRQGLYRRLRRVVGGDGIGRHGGVGVEGVDTHGGEVLRTDDDITGPKDGQATRIHYSGEGEGAGTRTDHGNCGVVLGEVQRRATQVADADDDLLGGSVATGAHGVKDFGYADIGGRGGEELDIVDGHVALKARAADTAPLDLDDLAREAREVHDGLQPGIVLGRLLRAAQGPDQAVHTARKHPYLQGAHGAPEHVVPEAEAGGRPGPEVDTGGKEGVGIARDPRGGLGKHIDRAAGRVVIQRAGVKRVLNTVGLHMPASGRAGVGRGPATAEVAGRAGGEGLEVLRKGQARQEGRQDGGDQGVVGVVAIDGVARVHLDLVEGVGQRKLRQGGEGERREAPRGQARRGLGHQRAIVDAVGDRDAVGDVEAKVGQGHRQRRTAAEDATVEVGRHDGAHAHVVVQLRLDVDVIVLRFPPGIGPTGIGRDGEIVVHHPQALETGRRTGRHRKGDGTRLTGSQQYRTRQLGRAEDGIVIVVDPETYPRLKGGVVHQGRGVGVARHQLGRGKGRVVIVARGVCRKNPQNAAELKTRNRVPNRGPCTVVGHAELCVRAAHPQQYSHH